MRAGFDGSPGKWDVTTRAGADDATWRRSWTG
jgi:hypothetical protein